MVCSLHFVFRHATLLPFKEKPWVATPLGWTIIFLTGEGRGGKFGNKFFAEAVNTEINCMQEKKSVCRKT